MDQVAPSQSDGFSGTVNRIQLTDLIQLVCLAQMNSVVQVESGLGSGTICVRSGQVLHAETGGAKGEEAFYKIFRWKSGNVLILPLPEEVIATISRSWEYLLIEAMNIRDEKSEPKGDDEEATTGAPSDGFNVALDHIQLSDLVQLLCSTRNDHLIEVRSDQGTGKFFASSGEIIHAQTGELNGEEAFYEVFGWSGGTFEALSPQDDPVTSIDKHWEYLLMEAMRLQDEKMGVDEDEERLSSLTQRIQKMKVAEKIKLAMTGDKETRTLLIRDSSRLVQFAVISNPRLTESEVASIAYSRSIDEEVLRKIANNREWIKQYTVRAALVNNPKTPLPISMKLVPTLTAQDLKHLSKSKAVPNAVATAARRLVAEKEQP